MRCLLKLRLLVNDIMKHMHVYTTKPTNLHERVGGQGIFDLDPSSFGALHPNEGLLSCLQGEHAVR